MRTLRNWQAALIVFMLFVLPHLALRFSSIPLVGGVYALFIVSIFIFFLFVFFAKLSLSKSAAIFSLWLLAVLTYGVIKGVFAGYGIINALKAGYETVGPLALFILIVVSGVSVKNLNLSIIRPILIVAFINGICTAYQYFFITDYRMLWFYQPLIGMGQELHEWSFSRDGVIRGVGLFTSPLENVYLILFVTYYLAIRTWQKSWQYSIPLILCIGTGYLTGVRTFFVALLIGLTAWILLKVRKTFGPFLIFVTVPLAAIVGTYLVLILKQDSLDLSSLDRLRQLLEIAASLIQSPSGYGLGSVGIGKDFSFDSANGVWLISYGIVGGVAILFLYYRLAKMLLTCLSSAALGHESDLLLALILFAASLLYISQFQYALVTPGRWYFVFASAIAINHLHYKKRTVRD